MNSKYCKFSTGESLPAQGFAISGRGRGNTVKKISSAKKFKGTFSILFTVFLS